LPYLESGAGYLQSTGYSGYLLHTTVGNEGIVGPHGNLNPVPQFFPNPSASLVIAINIPMVLHI